MESDGASVPGHSPPRETTESSSGVSPVPSECGLEPKGISCLNPMVGFLRVHAREEVNISVAVHRSRHSYFIQTKVNYY
jgi:hypothetical protein